MTEAVVLLLAILSVLLMFFAVCILFLLVQGIRVKKKKAENEAGSCADTVLVIYASQSDTAKQLALQTAAWLRTSSCGTATLNIQDLSVAQLIQAKQAIFIVSTYGEGDAPDSAQQFIHERMLQSIDLSHLEFAMLALGDRRYEHFCQFGLDLNAWLLNQQARPWFDLICANQADKQSLLLWRQQLAQAFNHGAADFKLEKDWQAAALLTRTLLNAGSQGASMYELKFAVPSGMQWRSGDIAEVRCMNSARVLQELQSQFPILQRYSASELKFKDLRALRMNSTHAQLLHEIDLAQLPDLPMREYSIASLCSSGQLALVVRQECTEHGLGLGSGLLTNQLALGESIHVHVRSNTAFHLINDADADEQAPAIFIGNGSGIAGLLAHLHQRIEQGVSQNWLIYGERQAQFDAVFTEPLQRWHAQGALPMLDLVYSRDNAALKYVQDVLHAKAELLRDWVSAGACIYVCGSLNGMAQGVDASLCEVLGETDFAALKKAGCYKRDVY